MLDFTPCRGRQSRGGDEGTNRGERYKYQSYMYEEQVTNMANATICFLSASLRSKTSTCDSDDVCVSVHENMLPAGSVCVHVPQLDLGWLSGHLDAGLQDGNGEVRVGRGAEPQAEVCVRFFHLQMLYQLVQLGHPGEGQVAVCQEHPVTWEGGNAVH